MDNYYWFRVKIEKYIEVKVRSKNQKEAEDKIKILEDIRQELTT